jgi:hypothetical protein
VLMCRGEDARFFLRARRSSSQQVARMSQRVGAKRRPMTGSAICGSDVAGAMPMQKPGYRSAHPGYARFASSSGPRFGVPRTLRSAISAVTRVFDALWRCFTLSQDEVSA